MIYIYIYIYMYNIHIYIYIYIYLQLHTYIYIQLYTHNIYTYVWYLGLSKNWFYIPIYCPFKTGKWSGSSNFGYLKTNPDVTGTGMIFVEMGNPKTIQFVAHFWWETHSGILGSVSQETWSALKQHSSGIWLKQNWKKRVKHENSKKSG